MLRKFLKKIFKKCLTLRRIGRIIKVPDEERASENEEGKTMLKSTAIKMLSALEALRVAENAKSGGKSPDDYDYRVICADIAKEAGFRSRAEWMAILNGEAKLVDC